MDKKCAIKGIRDVKNFDEEKKTILFEKIKNIIGLLHVKYEINTFYCGMALGADLLCAGAILDYNDRFNTNIKIIPVIPCKNQTKLWKQEDIKNYNYILNNSLDAIILNEKYTRTCMLERNRYMVDNSEFLFAVYDGRDSGGTRYTLDYAIKKEKKIIFVDTKTFKLFKNFY